MKEHET